MCICEDDVIFQDGFIEKMLAAVNEMEAPTFDGGVPPLNSSSCEAVVQLRKPILQNELLEALRCFVSRVPLRKENRRTKN